MAEQADHLIGATGWPNAVIQVIPAATAVHDGVNGGGFAIADFEDGPGLGYLEIPLRGQPVTDHKEVAALAVAFDRLRAEALPRRPPCHYWKKRQHHGAKPCELAQGQLQRNQRRRLRRSRDRPPALRRGPRLEKPGRPGPDHRCTGWQDFIADVRAGRHDLT
jgi:hypothetical protein